MNAVTRYRFLPLSPTSDSPFSKEARTFPSDNSHILLTSLSCPTYGVHLMHCSLGRRPAMANYPNATDNAAVTYDATPYSLVSL